MRDMLSQQLQMKQDTRDSDLRKDKEMVNEATRLNEIEKEKHKEKEQ